MKDILTPANISVGEKIRLLRKVTRLSQVELARDADLTTGTISEIENNKSNPQKGTLTSIVNAFQLTQREFDTIESYRVEIWREVFPGPIVSKSQTKIALERLVQEHLAENQNQPFSPVQAAKELGLSRQRIHQLLEPLRARYPDLVLTADVIRQKATQRRAEKEQNAAKRQAKQKERKALDKKIIRLTKKGLGNLEIAEKLGKTKNQIMARKAQLNKSGKNVRVRRERTQGNKLKLRREAVASYFNDGYSAQQIANKINTSVSNVENDIRKLRAAGIIDQNPKEQ